MRALAQKQLALQNSVQLAQQVVQQAIQRVLTDAEARIKEIQGDGKNLWAEVGGEHNIDLVNTQWGFDDATGEIFEQSINFVSGPPA